MRIDATIFLEVKDGDKDIEIPITEASPASANDVITRAFCNGWWSGIQAGTGTFYPAVRLHSARVVYRSHCGHDECTEPYSKESDSYAELVSTPRAHSHVLPKLPAPPPPPPKEKKSGPAKRRR